MCCDWECWRCRLHVLAPMLTPVLVTMLAPVLAPVVAPVLPPTAGGEGRSNLELKYHTCLIW